MNFFGLFTTKNYFNRREFITNYFIAQIFILIFNSIYGWFSFAIIMLSKNLTLQKNFSSEITAFIEAIIEFLLLKNSIEKRISDIVGEDSQNKVWTLSFICNFIGVFVLRYLSFAIEHKYYNSELPVCMTALFCLVIWLILFCKPGKQSSTEKISDIKFNWGAFWGTWIWGLMNKIKTTLLFFPLILVSPSAYFYFALICGLKGNEWLLSKSTENSIKNLHEKQKKQAWILFFLIPVITTCFFFAIHKILRYGNNYDVISTKLNKFVSLATKKTTDATFERIEYSEDQYKFYITIDIWSSMTNEERIKLYELIIRRVLIDKELNNLQQIPIEIINNIAIYDSKNNYRLFYCQVPEEYESISSQSYELKKVIRRFSR